MKRSKAQASSITKYLLLTLLSVLCVGTVFSMEERPKRINIVNIEGISAAGKTTLVNGIRKFCKNKTTEKKVITLIEPFDEWCHFGSSNWNFFQVYLDDLKNLCLLFSIYVYFNHINNLENTLNTCKGGEVIVLDRSAWSEEPYNRVALQSGWLNEYDLAVLHHVCSGCKEDIHCAGEFTCSEGTDAYKVLQLLLSYCKNKTLSYDEMRVHDALGDLYQEIFTYIAQSFHRCKQHKPDLTVYLKASAQTCWQRDEERGRKFKDPGADDGSFHNQHFKAHELWLEKGLWLGEKISVPLYVIDAEPDFKDNERLRVDMINKLLIKICQL